MKKEFMDRKAVENRFDKELTEVNALLMSNECTAEHIIGMVNTIYADIDKHSKKCKQISSFINGMVMATGVCGGAFCGWQIYKGAKDKNVYNLIAAAIAAGVFLITPHAMEKYIRKLGRKMSEKHVIAMKDDAVFLTMIYDSLKTAAEKEQSEITQDIKDTSDQLHELLQE